MNWNLIVWTTISSILLAWLVRLVHVGLQELFLLLTGDASIAVYLFQILMLPGVVLHELSHYLTAKLLGVRVRSISLKPNVSNGKVQMGAVSMNRPDFVRGVLIGIAPLLSGTAAILLIGYHVFDVNAVIEAAQNGGITGVAAAVRSVFEVNDAWIWLYLLFVFGNAMLPSESDRESVWPMLALLGIILTVAALAGFGPEVFSGLSKALQASLSVIVVAFSITLFVDAIFAIIIWLLRGVVAYVSGRRLDRAAS
jgi:hypothetical protein